MSVIDLFSEAIEISDPDERQSFLDRACAGDAELRRQVQEMLEHYFDPETFMKGPAVGASTQADPVTSETTPAEKSGDRIGHYKLLEKIGEGGMGVIYMAEQEKPVVRRVALKIIKWGMDSKQVVARFEAERQALALMDHPHIAKVLDAGATESGRPFFVMELVRGIPITEYCDTNRLTTGQRLELFITVCQAIQHAHQKGIVHRDIKPSNILVTLSDDKAHPMVIDFGIAKALHQKLTEKTLFTNFGLAIGTPAYMSPEQAQMNKLDVDTRSDVYSLGVLLYELLTGKTPFTQEELMSGGYGEMQRIIAEHEPPKPSLRVSTLRAEEKKSTAQLQMVKASSLGHTLQGDLDWIVMKSLEKDRMRRYETVSGFSADIQRHLNDEPVSAVAPSFGYQLLKLYQRYRRQMKWLGAAVGLILGFAVVSTALAIQLERQNRLADDRLFASLVSQADAIQRAGGVGYHTNVIATIQQAVDLKGQDLNESDKRSLREIAMATIGDPWIRTRTSRQYSVPDYESVTRIISNPDSAALGYNQGFVRIHDILTGELEGELKNGHQEPIHSIAPTRGGDVWVTADIAGKIVAWEREPRTAQWRVMAELTETGFPNSPMVQACGDGVLIYAEESNQAHLWRPGSGDAPEQIQLPVNVALVTWVRSRPRPDVPKNYVTMSISSDGRWLAIPEFDEATVVVFDLESREIVSTIRDNAPQSGFVHVEFGPSDDVLCLGWSEKISVYDTRDWLRQASIKSNTQGMAWNFRIAPSRPWIIYGRIRKTVWNYRSNAIVSTIEDFPWTARFKPNGTDVFTVGAGFNQRDRWIVQELTGLEEPSTFTVDLPVESLRYVSFSPDGRWLAATSREGLLITDLNTLHTVRLELPDGIEGTINPSFSHDGKLLACSEWDEHSLMVWDTQSWRMIKTEGAAPHFGVLFHPKRDFLVVNHGDALSLYQYERGHEEGQELLKLKEVGRVDINRAMRYFEFSDDGDYFAWADQAAGDVMHSHLSVAKLSVGGLEVVFELEDVVSEGIDFLPNSDELIVSRFHSQDSSKPENWVPEQWNFVAGTKKPLHRYDAKASGLSVAPRDGLFATLSSSAGVALFDWKTRQSLGRMSHFKSAPKRIQWTPDGTRLAILFGEGEIQIWDIEKMRGRLDALGLDW